MRAVSTYCSSPTDQALPEQALQGRVQALSVAFAYRLKRKLRVLDPHAFLASRASFLRLALASRSGFARWPF